MTLGTSWTGGEERHRRASRLEVVKAGKLPAPACQMPGGTNLVEAPEREEAGEVLYAQAASADQKADLERGVARLGAFAANNGMRVAKVVAEVGSGRNGHRQRRMGVLRFPEDGAIEVDRRDRLARFGSESNEPSLAGTRRRRVVVDPEEVKEDLASMCSLDSGRVCMAAGRQGAGKR
jgi:putative resolvase